MRKWDGILSFLLTINWNEQNKKTLNSVSPGFATIFMAGRKCVYEVSSELS